MQRKNQGFPFKGRDISFPKKVESVRPSRLVQPDKHTFIMKYWFHLISILLSLMIGVPAGYAQEEDSTPPPVSEQSVMSENEDLPSMEEIDRRRALAELRRLEIQNSEDDGGMVLAFVMPFAAFIFVLTLMWIIFSYERKKDHNRHETIRVYLEKGLEVPPQLLIDKDNPQTWRATSDLRKGIIWTVIGVGISVTVLILVGSDRGAVLGLIPVCIGIGYFIAAKLDPRPTQKPE